MHSRFSHSSPRRRGGRIPRPNLLPAPLAAFMSALILAAGLALLASCTFDLDYDRYAIVFGVADYPGTEYDLSYCDDDALDLENLLLDQGYPISNIYREIDGSANRTNLEIYFSTVAAAAEKEDLFLFYYSGHGGQRSELPQGSEDTFGSDSPAEWIFLHDSLIYTPPNTYTEDLGEAISDDTLAEWLRTIPCARKIVIIDACNSGGFIGNAVEADAIPPDYTQGSDGLFEILGNTISLYANFQDYGSDITPGDALVIAASGEREYSYESLPYENGVMTYFLLESAERGDVNGDNYITVSESYFYIYNHINKDWNPVAYLNGADVYFPHISGGPVDYILFTK